MIMLNVSGGYKLIAGRGGADHMLSLNRSLLAVLYILV